MASISVRNLDDDLHARLRQRAARAGRSTEAEVRAILAAALTDETETSFDDLAAKLRKLSAGRKHTPSEVLIREGRVSR